MKKSKFSEEQIAYVLRQVEGGSPVADVCLQMGVSEATFDIWKKKDAHLGVAELRQLRSLKDEHARQKRPFRVLTVVDQWSRQSPILEVASSLSGATVGQALDRVLPAGTTLRSVTLDHGTEFTARALEGWAFQRGVQLDFTRPGKPVDNAFIESFNGRLRDECLNVHQFTSIEDARAKIEAWRVDYNQHRPHGSLGRLTPNEYAQRRQDQPTVQAAIFLASAVLFRDQRQPHCPPLSRVAGTRLRRTPVSTSIRSPGQGFLRMDA